jgi:uncharacterized membrane protein
METAVNRLLIAAAAAFFAVTAFFGAGAEAGFNVRLKTPSGFSTLEKAGCGGGGYRRFFRKRYQSVRRSVKPKVQVARAPAKSESIAKVEPKAETAAEPEAKVAVSENSSISTASGKVAEVKPVGAAKPEEKSEKKVAAAKDLGCKQFFPSVGLTLSVSCE